MKAQQSQSRSNDDNHQPRRLNRPGMQGPTPCAPHTPGHGEGSSPFLLLLRSHTLPFPAQPIWASKHCSPSATQVPWEDSAQQGPDQQQDRTPGNLPPRAPGFPREAGCPPLAWSTFPQTCVCVASVRSRSFACASADRNSGPGWATD